MRLFEVSQEKKNAQFRATASARAWHRLANEARRAGDVAEERACLARAYAQEDRAADIAASPFLAFLAFVVAAALFRR